MALTPLALLAACGGFPSNPHALEIAAFLGQRISAPRFAYLSIPSTNQVVSGTVDSYGRLTQTGGFTQGSSPAMLAPDVNGRFLHFQTTGASTIHWRPITSTGVTTTGGSLVTTSSAILFRSTVYTNFMIGLVQGGGSSLQSYPLALDGSVTAPQAGMDPGTNYAAMVQHPTLPLVYILENSASIHVSQMSASGTFSLRASVPASTPSAIAMDPLGRFLITGNALASNNLTYFSLDSQGIPTQGATITAGPAGVAHIALDSAGRYAYVLKQTAGANLVTVQISSFSVVGTTTSGNTPSNAISSLVVENAGRFLYATGGLPPGIALMGIASDGLPYASEYYTAAAAPTIGLYHTTRCMAFPDVDC